MLTQASCISLFPMSSEQKYMDLLSLSHSHLSSHLSIISFLLSVNCSNFSLICAQNANKRATIIAMRHFQNTDIHVDWTQLHLISTFRVCRLVPHLLWCVVLACQQRLAQLDAGGEAVVTRVDLSLDALVIVHEQLHRGHVPAASRCEDTRSNEMKPNNPISDISDRNHNHNEAHTHLGFSWASMRRMTSSIQSMRSRTMLKKRNLSPVSRRRALRPSQASRRFRHASRTSLSLRWISSALSPAYADCKRAASSCSCLTYTHTQRRGEEVWYLDQRSGSGHFNLS